MLEGENNVFVTDWFSPFMSWLVSEEDWQPLLVDAGQLQCGWWRDTAAADRGVRSFCLKY